MTGAVPFGTIPQLVRDAARRHGGREALVDGAQRLTFEELRERADAAARGFVAIGLRPGDRVGFWAPNSAEWVVAALGAWCAGGVVVPLNTRFKGGEAAYVLAASGARVLCCANGFLGTDYVAMLGGCGEQLPELERIVVLSGEAPEGTLGWSDFLAGGADVDPATVTARAAAVSPDDVSDLIFTSGTTGRPKGVMTTHHQTLQVFWDWSGIVGLTADDRYLIVNPFFHTFGLKAGLLAALMRGATAVPEAVLDVPTALARVADERITMLPGPPTLYLSILNHPDRHRFDLSSLRLAVTGAAVVPVEMIRRMREELTFRTIVTGYGLTESSGVVSMCQPDDDPETIATTCGRPLPGTQLRIVDDEGRAVPAGQPGEVVTRGYHVMRGYFGDPEATAAAIDADGWLHTGDVGVLDERGYLRITDRKKDMFIVGGFNAYPAEIEQLLMAHPDIAQVAVVGVPDDRLGEVGVAFVVPRPGHAVDPDGLVAWSREHMANYKVPRQVLVVDVLPTNAAGKVLKFELRDHLSSRSGPRK